MEIKRFIPKSIKKAIKPFFLRVLPLPRPFFIITRGPRPFLVITRGRSGSNFLVSMLESHPNLYLHYEIFLEEKLRTVSIQQMINSIGAIEYIKQCYRQRGYEEAIGCKILYYQLEPEYAERMKIPSISLVQGYLRRSCQIKVIHLKRRNKLKILTSVKLARLTRQWSLRADENPLSNKLQISLTPEECENEFLQIEGWEMKYDQLFQYHPLINVYYEDLIADIPLMTKQILDFLKVPYKPLTTNLKKQSNRPLSEIITNYSELQAYFCNTRWAEFFK